MAGLSSRVGRPLALTLPLLAFVLSGCDQESYPTDLSYALRTDTLVTKTPSSTPFDPEPPGQLGQSVERLREQGGEAYDPTKVSGELRQQLRRALNDNFGTPAAPRVAAADNADVQEAVDKLKLDEASLVAGSKLYRRHCLHCHGLNGDGRGPTGPWVSPHPRDYRQGRFKFVSTALPPAGQRDLSEGKPRRPDLKRTLEQGVDGTTMPSFNFLSDTELENLVSYVLHLSLRGEVEYNTLRTILEAGGETANLEEGDIDTHVPSRLKLFLDQWAAADKSEEPQPYRYQRDQLAASIHRGYELFTDTKGEASCISCHVDFGRQVPFRYDEWGTLVRPSNLTAGVYRGGRRPIDLYWRIRRGIPPSGMPGAKLNTAADKDDYWDLVNFLQALPYPQMMPPDIAVKIYDQPKEPSAHPARPEHAAR
jgi:mono/diheme cytochrome c family protein